MTDKSKFVRAVSLAEHLACEHRLDFKYVTDPDEMDALCLPPNSGRAYGDIVEVGKCDNPDHIVAITAHEIGHFATGYFHRAMHHMVFAGDHHARYHTPEWTSIGFQIPIERAAWIYAYRMLKSYGVRMSFSSIWMALKYIYGYRICNGGNHYRYEQMSWLEKRRVDARALLAIAFGIGCPVKYEYIGIQKHKRSEPVVSKSNMEVLVDGETSE